MNLKQILAGALTITIIVIIEPHPTACTEPSQNIRNPQSPPRCAVDCEIANGDFSNELTGWSVHYLASANDSQGCSNPPCRFLSGFEAEDLIGQQIQLPAGDATIGIGIKSEGENLEGPAYLVIFVDDTFPPTWPYALGHREFSMANDGEWHRYEYPITVPAHPGNYWIAYGIQTPPADGPGAWAHLRYDDATLDCWATCWWTWPCNTPPLTLPDGCDYFTPIEQPSTPLPAPCVRTAYTETVPNDDDPALLDTHLVIVLDHPEMPHPHTQVVTIVHVPGQPWETDYSRDWTYKCGRDEAPLAWTIREILNTGDLTPADLAYTPTPPHPHTPTLPLPLLDLLAGLSGTTTAGTAGLDLSYYLPIITRETRFFPKNLVSGPTMKRSPK